MHDYTSSEIKDILLKVGIRLGDTIYCHSNIGLFGYIENYQSKRQICEEFYKAIFNIIGPKGTLIVPTYTTHIPSNNQTFDSKNTASKMGVFAEWVRTHTDSIRSLDPFFSVAAMRASVQPGPSASALSSTCARRTFCEEPFSFLMTLRNLSRSSFVRRTIYFFCMATLLGYPHALSNPDKVQF